MNMKTNVIICTLCGCAMMLALPLCANTYDASGETVLSNITETTRTVKTNGSGTLILSGTNELYGLQMSAGTLKINGGLTTVTGPGGTAGNTATFGQAGGITIIEGGATLAVNNTSSYSTVIVGGTLMVTNGSYEIAGEILNAFGSAATQKLVIQDEGVVTCGVFRVSQTSANSDNIGLFLNTGGKLYTTLVGKDGNGRTGVIRYNGGTIYKTTSGELYGKAGKSETTWDDVLSYVDEGGFHFVYDPAGSVTMNVPLFSGAANDGGVHYSSSNGRWFYLGENYQNSTFNGGTWIEGSAYLIDSLGLSDAAFGTPPTSPTNNIFFSGSPTLFTGGKNYTINRNRNIWIASGSTATIGCNSEGTGLRIGGTISVPDGENAATNTIFKAGNGTWGGFIVFDPGEGRTNRLDKLHVVRNLEIASGVTIVRSPSSGGTESNAPLYIEGNNSAYTSGYKSYGNLKVSGGKLVIEGKRYMEANKWGQVLVSGGMISGMTDKAEYLNGLSSTPGRLTIENGGKVEFSLVRIGQGWDYESEINVNTGGVLRASQICMGNKSKAALNLNGGTIVSYESPTMSTADRNLYRNNFLGDDSDKWERANVRVLAGGAKFNTDGYSPTVRTPLLSGVGAGETDGGLTKLGDGTLTMTTTNTYNGVTRLEGGTLAFSHANGRPDGDIEFSAEGLMSCTNAPLLTANALSFRAGCGIRVTEAETLDIDTWTGGWHTVATFDNDITAMPDIKFIKSDGTVLATARGWGSWTFRISADKKSLEFRGTHGMMLIVR